MVNKNIFSNSMGGGGLFAWSVSGSVELTDNRFLNNTADGSVHPHGGGADVRSDSGAVTLSKNIFSGNMAKSYGGGVSTSSSSETMRLTNNVFSDNTALDSGGALSGISENGLIYLVNNTLWQNTAKFYEGGGVYTKVYDNSARVYFYNNIIWNNTSVYRNGDDLYVDTDGNDDGTGSYLLLRNNDLGSNADFNTGWSEDFVIKDTDNYFHWDNITLDPHITSNSHLFTGSPAIDTGICGLHKGHHYLRFAPYDDMDGDKRPGDEQEYGCDIGADEYKAFSWPISYRRLSVRGD